MNIAGYKITVNGQVKEEDTVLLEDTVLFLQDKLDKTDLHEIRSVEGGYDFLIHHSGEAQVVRLRRDAQGEWTIDLPAELDDMVQQLPV
ncbi:MAG: hypothetical protein U5L04_08265 [Trueperaceae bacterium]|nr:hypothetical protein [Trueperaceae bacterium]